MTPIKRDYTSTEFHAGMQKIKAAMEDLYGVSAKTRTAKQWAALVAKYGMADVMRIERMTESEVNKRCKEKFGERLKRMFKGKSTGTIISIDSVGAVR